MTAKPGREADFDALAESVLSRANDFTAFGEPNGQGGYRAISMSPHE